MRLLSHNIVAHDFLIIRAFFESCFYTQLLFSHQLKSVLTNHKYRVK